MLFFSRRRAAVRKRAHLVIFGAEGMDDGVAGDGFLQDLAELAHLFLGAAAGAADAAAHARGGNKDDGQDGKAEEGEPPVGLHDHEQEERAT